MLFDPVSTVPATPPRRPVYDVVPSHLIVVAVLAAMSAVTVSLRAFADCAKAVAGPVYPPETVQVGTFPATKTALVELIVIVSANSLVPPVVIVAPVPESSAVAGVKTKVRNLGTRPTTSSFEVATEVKDDAVAARVSYVAPAVADVVSFVVTIVNGMVPAPGFTAKAPAVALATGVPMIMTLAEVRASWAVAPMPAAPITVRTASFAGVAPPSRVPNTVIVLPAT